MRRSGWGRRRCCPEPRPRCSRLAGTRGSIPASVRGRQRAGARPAACHRQDRARVALPARGPRRAPHPRARRRRRGGRGRVVLPGGRQAASLRAARRTGACSASRPGAWSPPPSWSGPCGPLPDGVGLVQPYIEGRLISVNGVAFEGELHGANQHVVHRVWPDRCGQAVYAETIPMAPERERAVAAFMSELGWNGVFNLQLIERDGRDYVIDLNPRFYVSLTLAVAAGLNLPAIWTSLLLGLPFERAATAPACASARRRAIRGRSSPSFGGAARGRRGACSRAAAPCTRCSRSATRARAQHRRGRGGCSATKGRGPGPRRERRDRSAEQVLVLLHGRWYRPGSMQELARAIDLPGWPAWRPRRRIAAGTRGASWTRWPPTSRASRAPSRGPRDARPTGRGGRRTRAPGVRRVLAGSVPGVRGAGAAAPSAWPRSWCCAAG